MTVGLLLLLEVHDRRGRIGARLYDKSPRSPESTGKSGAVKPKIYTFPSWALISHEESYEDAPLKFYRMSAFSNIILLFQHSPSSPTASEAIIS